MTKSDWQQPTTVLQRFGDVIQLLCSGNRPDDSILIGWLDETSEELQSFCVNHGPVWCQGIAVIDAALQMVDQPTEGVDHEHR